MVERVDAVVIGAGVIGLACARALARTGRDVIVLERGFAIGEHTSSRNSEVIHAGIYYTPGSLKARLCVEGKRRLYRYLEARGLGFRRCGKVIVATSDAQTAKLDGILQTAAATGVHDLELLSADEVQAREPAVRAVAGLWSPSTGILDSHAFMVSLQGDMERHGGVIAFGSTVETVSAAGGPLRVTVSGRDSITLEPSILVNAAGLDAIPLAQRIEGVPRDAIPDPSFAVGHYYAYTSAAPFTHLVYPVPEPGGLGIHATLDLGGQVRFGPDVRWIDAPDYTFDDSQRDRFIEAVSSYFPGLEPNRLQPGYTGVRPKIAGPGDPAADFMISGPADHHVEGLVNLFGIESPGLTASLAIADAVLEKLGLTPVPD